MSMPRAPTLIRKTDLTGSLGNANIHDVHDSDTAHQQGDSCHTTREGW